MKFFKHISLFILLLLVVSVSNVQAYTLDELEWEDMGTRTLKLNEYMIGDEYKIKIVDFNPPVKGRKDADGNIIPEQSVTPFVLLQLYRDSDLIDTFALGQDGTHIVDDDVRVIVEDIPGPDSVEWVYESYNPWVKLTLQKVEMPYFDISINKDKSVYSYGDDLGIIQLIINNTGANANDVDIIIETDGLNLVKGKNKEHIQFIQYGESIERELYIGIPKIFLNSKNYDLSVVVAGYDVRGKMISNTQSQKIITGSDVGPTEVISFTKSMEESAYYGDKVMVKLTIHNGGDFNIDSAIINDSIPDKFEPVGNFSLNWHSSIQAGEDWTTSYLLKPLEYGVYKISAAKLNISVYESKYSLSSNEPKITIFGPKISLTKSGVIQPDGSVSVNVKLVNSGNIPTKVSIVDAIPENSVIIDGDNRATIFADKMSSNYLSYNLVSYEQNDTISLPAATAFFSVGGYNEKVVSNNLTIRAETKIFKEKTFNVPPSQDRLETTTYDLH
ncbi:MAG: hypothetical protein K0A90_05795, partial [Methanosarcinaceae archaeon]|nr:hypothetical protein [Methanosarcinaceae archaeon]